jgi:predicted RNase H-like HicB family nuclease
MIPKYDVIVEWDSAGYYVATLPQLNGLRVEGQPFQSAEDLELEVREGIEEFFRQVANHPTVSNITRFVDDSEPSSPNHELTTTNQQRRNVERRT